MQNPLKNLNIFIILGGLFLIALGYVLMSTESFIDAEQFSLSLYVSPPLIMAGHAVIIWGIIARGKKSGSDSPDTNDKFAKETYN
ncbi:MAG TPA: hypothetical protein VHS96_11430 [Bacteroidia bacterium]|jgi:hypothetical protein|nr:hypothetical protein [Bacteroidia bacterium]